MVEVRNGTHGGLVADDTDLHYLYLITPYFKNLDVPNWTVFIKLLARLSPSERRIAEMYGIKEDKVKEYVFSSDNLRLPAIIKESHGDYGAASEMYQYQMCLSE